MCAQCILRRMRKESIFSDFFFNWQQILIATNRDNMRLRSWRSYRLNCIVRIYCTKTWLPRAHSLTLPSLFFFYFSSHTHTCERVNEWTKKTKRKKLLPRFLAIILLPQKTANQLHCKTSERVTVCVEFDVSFVVVASEIVSAQRLHEYISFWFRNRKNAHKPEENWKKKQEET